MKLVKFCLFFLLLPLQYGSTLLEQLGIDLPLFGHQYIQFEPDAHMAVQQEYLFKALRENPGQYALLLANLKNYIKTYSSRESSTNTESLYHQVLNHKLKNVATADRLVMHAFFLLNSPQTEDFDEPWLKRFLREGSDPANPQWVRFLTALGSLKVMHSRPALNITTQAVEATLNEISAKPSQDPMLHFSMGNFYLHYYENHNPYRWLRMVTLELERARAADPRNRNLFTRITSIYIAMQTQFEERAVVQPFEFEELVYRRIIMLDSRNAWAYNNLAFLYCQNNVEQKEALRHARIANELEQGNPYLMDTLGWCLYRNQMLDDARQTLESARALRSDLADVHFHLATVYYDLGDKQKSIQSFLDCLKVDPDNQLALNNLAYTYAEEGIELERALEMSLKAVSINPDNSAFVDTLGWIYFRLNRLQEAEETLKRAISLAPDAHETHLHLAEVYKKLHQPDLEDEHRRIAAKLNGSGTFTPDPDQKEVVSVSPVGRGDETAYRLLFATIVEARNRYLADPSTDKSPHSVKVFYDQLISLVQSRGDTSLLQRLAMEFDAYRRAQTPNPTSIPSAAANSDPLTQTADLDLNFLHLFSEDSLLVVQLARAELKVLLQEILQSEVLKLNIPKDVFSPLINDLLPSQIAFGITTDLQTVAAFRIQPEQRQILAENLGMLSGQSVLAPFTGLRVNITGVAQDRWLFRIGDQSVWLQLRNNSAILTSKSDYFQATHHNPLASSAVFQSKRNPESTFVYSRELSTLTRHLLESDIAKTMGLDKIHGVAVLELIGTYLCSFSLASDSLSEVEYFFARDTESFSKLQQALKIHISDIETKFKEQHGFKIESELKVFDNQAFEVVSKVARVSDLIRYILKQVHKIKQESSPK